MVDVSLLLAASVAYLALLFAIAEVTERSPWLRQRVSSHPLVYGLSLCVYATSWTFYGSVGFAQDHGYSYAAIGLGVALSALLIPMVWAPLARIVRERQLSSVADLFADRYRSQALGVVVTVLSVCGSLPYLALQFRAVTESMTVLSGAPNAGAPVGWAYLAIVTLFAILFGIRHSVARRQHPGLIAAVAFESLVKLLALITLVVAALLGVFDGLAGLNAWLALHPEALERLYEPVRSGPWLTLLMLTMGAAFLLPRQFHLAFTECGSERALRHAMWTFPGLILLFYGATPILVWAGWLAAPGVHPDMVVLSIAARWRPVAILTFIGGLSASSAMIIVTSLALSAMLLNHVAVPLGWIRGELYRGLRWARRLLVILVTTSGFAVFVALEYRGGLVGLGLIAFVAVAQLVPGLVGVLAWPGATRVGVLSGLCAGMTVWAVLLLPVLFWPSWDLASRLSPGLPAWATCSYASLGLNVGLTLVVSLVLPERARSGARASTRSDLSHGRGSVALLHERLSPLLGPEATSIELRRALDDLALASGVLSESDLERLSLRIERNLTGLVGPLMASAIVGNSGRERRTGELAELVSTLEVRGASASGGPARRLGEIVSRVLDELPIAVCALDGQARVVMWNQRLVLLSRLAPEAVLGRRVGQLPGPWGALLGASVAGAWAPIERELSLGGRRRVIRVTCCMADEGQRSAVALIVDDLSERQALEALLAHQERLASLGRLAAGVAHEIANPLTGLLMVASNLREELTVEEARQRLGLIIAEGRRIQAILESLVGFSRAGAEALFESMDLSVVDVAGLVADALQLVRLSGRSRGLVITSRCNDELLLECDAQRVSQVLINLLNNSCDACAPGARIEVAAWAEHEQVLIEVTDEGSGIAPEFLGRIFDPFFTLKQPGHGTGLGLSVAHGIVREHGGTLEVMETGRAGTRFLMRLPSRQPGARRVQWKQRIEAEHGAHPGR